MQNPKHLLLDTIRINQQKVWIRIKIPNAPTKSFINKNFLTEQTLTKNVSSNLNLSTKSTNLTKPPVVGIIKTVSINSTAYDSLRSLDSTRFDVRRTFRNNWTQEDSNKVKI